MLGSATGIHVKFFESRSLKKLEEEVNNFLQYHADKPTIILDIRYESDREEYSTLFTSMIVYRPDGLK